MKDSISSLSLDSSIDTKIPRTYLSPSTWRSQITTSQVSCVRWLLASIWRTKTRKQKKETAEPYSQQPLIKRDRNEGFEKDMLVKKSLRCCSGVICAALLLCMALLPAVDAFSPPSSQLSNSKRSFGSLRTINSKRAAQLQVAVGDIADIEEITNFASDNGITLSFTTFGPGEFSMFDPQDAPSRCSIKLAYFSLHNPNHTNNERLPRRGSHQK